MLSLRQTILVVEDEAAIADTIVYALKTEGFAPVWKRTAAEALEVLGKDAIALAILDVGLPDTSGLDVCREIRRRGEMPVIFLTARSAEVDRIVGLELGADDYVTKPFSPRELTARVRAILRRASGNGGAAKNGAKKGEWEHDEARCRILFRGNALELTRNEYRLLATLVKSPGRVFSREQLMNAAWDDPGAAMDRTVDAHVKLLRAKLKAAGAEEDAIVTHRGLGYALKDT